MGEILPRETSIPFHKPHRIPAARSASTTPHKGVWVKVGSAATAFVICTLPKTGLINTEPIAAEMATTAPTERSTPPVAITRVIPSATNIKGAELLKTSIRFPYKWPSSIPSLKNPGEKIASKMKIKASATSGQNRRFSRMRFIKGALFFIKSLPLFG